MPWHSSQTLTAGPIRQDHYSGATNAHSDAKNTDQNTIKAGLITLGQGLRGRHFHHPNSKCPPEKTLRRTLDNPPRTESSVATYPADEDP